MDPEESNGDAGGIKPKAMPADLPTSLDDRRHAPVDYVVPETEMYDGWQGMWQPSWPKRSRCNEASLLLHRPATNFLFN